jgi:hypothetical protein
VEIASIGQVTLSKGAIARLATSFATSEDNKSYPVLIASVKTGEVAVRLEESACAYLEAAGSAATTSRGASLSVIIRGSKMAVEATKGEVEITQISPQSRASKIAYGEIRRDALGNNVFIELSPRLDVEQRTARNITMRVTDKNDKPIPDLPVIFTVSKGLGVFPGGTTSFTATTNAEGAATAPFEVSQPLQRTGTITANVEGTDVSQTIEVRVKGKTVTPRRLLAVGAIAALVGVIIYVDPEPPRPPLRQEPPPTIP